MKIIPNLGPKARLGYVLFGVGLLALAVVAPFLESPWSFLVGAFGAIVAIEGAVGF